MSLRTAPLGTKFYFIDDAQEKNMVINQTVELNGFKTSLSFEVSKPALKDLFREHCNDRIVSLASDLLPLVQAEAAKQLAELAQTLELVVLREAAEFAHQEMMDQFDKS